MTIIFTQVARQDIDTVINYLSRELHNPKAADNFLTKLFSRAKVLSQFPEIGPRIKIGETINLSRYMIVDNYLLLYMIKDDAIYITRVVYGQSDYLRILGE